MEEMFGLRPGSGRNGETLQAGPTAPGGLWVAFGFFGGHHALQSLWRRSRRVGSKEREEDPSPTA
jgi:hypothetical protein